MEEEDDEGDGGRVVQVVNPSVMLRRFKGGCGAAVEEDWIG